jgi:hypothetical protein
VEGRTLTFGVSGYLYRSAVLYHDDETETFWSQMTGEAVVGPLAGKRLLWMPSEVATWKEWRTKHPGTTVLKPPRPLGGYLETNRYYDLYRRGDRIWFPTGPNGIGRKYPNKASVTIVLRDGKPRCYPHPALAEGESGDDGWKVVKQGASVRVVDAAGRQVPSMTAYWFAWCAFYPGGSVYAR